MKKAIILLFISCSTFSFGQVSVHSNTNQTIHQDSIVTFLNVRLKQYESNRLVQVADSVFISTKVDSTGKLELYSSSVREDAVVYGHFPDHYNWALEILQTIHLASADVEQPLFWSFRFGLNEPESYTAFQMDEVPRLDRLDPKLEINDTYLKSVFNYQINRELQYTVLDIQKLDSSNTEGLLKTEIIFGLDGKPEHIRILSSTYSPEFISYALDMLLRVELADGLTKNNKPARLSVVQTFEYLNPNKPLDQRWEKGLELYNKKDYYNAYFQWRALLYNDTLELDSTKIFKIGKSCLNSTKLVSHEIYYWYRMTGLEKNSDPYSYFGKEEKSSASQEDEEEEEEKPMNFSVVESKPFFKSCRKIKTEDERFICFQKEIMTSISKNFSYPKPCVNTGTSGKVFVSFVIEKDGTIQQVKIERSVDELLDCEAIRLLSILPEMNPAQQKGKPVRMSYTVPINFRLQ